MMRRTRITFSTSGHGAMRDLTPEIREVVRTSGSEAGVVHVFAIGSTAAVGTIEWEPGLAKDLPENLDRLIPPGRHYRHEQMWHDGNGHSHIQATLLGPSITIPFEEKELLLGQWQQVFHLECDVRPRQRTVILTVMGG